MAPATRLLDRLNVHTLDGVEVRAQVLGLVAEHLRPSAFHKTQETMRDGAFRRLAQRVDLELLTRFARADCHGRTGISTAPRWTGFWSAPDHWVSSTGHRHRS